MGNDLLMTDIEFPIVALLNETQISFLIDEVRIYMYYTIDTKLCY